MALNLNVSPYFDDFEVNKGYLKILFKPGNSVQARELTQIQSILQNQIGNLSDHFFKEGAMVIPGQSALDLNANYVKVSLPSTLSSASNFLGKIIQGKKTGIRALVVNYQDAVDVNTDGVIDFTNDEQPTLYLKYLEGTATAGTVVDNTTIEVLQDGTATFTVNGETVTLAEGQSSSFVEGEELFSAGSDGINYTATVLTSTDVPNPIGVGSLAFIEEGYYYVNQSIVRVATQSIVLDKYTNSPSYKIGLEILETVVSANDDSSLFDNALGTSNYNAPGADRYKVELKLTKRELDVVDTSNFIELITVRNGIISNYVTTTDYSVLLRTLARRTYDESGDYTVRPFKIDIREYFAENNNGGVYSMPDFAFDTEVAAKEFALQNFENDVGMVVNGEGLAHTISLVDRQTYPSQNLDTTGTKYYPGLTHVNLLDAVRDKLAIGLESGKAYVRGYEIERKPASRGSKYIIYDRARENFQLNNHYMPVNLGAFLYATDIKGLPKIDEPIDLVNMHISDFATTKFVTVNSNVDETTSNYLTSITYDQNATFFQGGGTNLGTNTYGIDIIGTAKVKSIEYFSESSSSAKPNVYTESTYRPDSASVESGIYKIYLYDIEYNLDPRTSIEYSMKDVRSIVSRNTVTPTGVGSAIYEFGANILHQLVLTDVQGTFTDKCMVFDKYNLTYRAINYYYDSLNDVMLVKPLNSGNMGSSIPSGALPSSTLQVNEVINEAIASASAGVSANAFNSSTSADLGNSSARIFSKNVLQNTNGSSIIDTGKNWVRTIRNIDDDSGATTVDTQYMVLKKFENVTTDASTGNISLTITNADTVFNTTNTSLYQAFVLADTNTPAGDIGILSTFTFSGDLKTATFNVSNLANGTTNVIVYAPVQKTTAREKSKTIVSNVVELTLTLVDSLGATISSPDYNNTVGATNDFSTTYGTDVLGTNSSVSIGTVNPTFTVGSNNDIQLSLSNLQLKNSDIKELTKLYDTCNVNNVAYRTGVISSDKKYIHQMNSTDFEFAFKAYEFYEQTGVAPWDIGVNLTDSATTLQIVNNALTVDGIANPFAEDIRTAYLNGQSLAADNTAPVKLNDITSRYKLFNGQKPSIIQLGELDLIQGNVPCGGRPIVIYSYYSHGLGDYASADSYLDGYSTIGYFGQKRLSDVLDFRPAVTYQQLTGYPLGEGIISTSTEYPVHNSAISADLRVYTGRKDKLYMTRTGDVKIKYGASSEEPMMPEDPDDGMVLYELTSQPYTLDNHAISLKMIENKRYTMRDIGKLEKRIENLEYYTTLNLLEKDTLDLSVKDENGNDRFKNGFIVDNFANHSVGNVFDPDYRVSIDKSKGELRPFFTEKNINMQINYLSSVGYQIAEQKIYLPYTNSYLITQEKSSKTVNVNPYAIFSFRGNVTLFPSTDEWKDTRGAPDIVTDRREEYDNIYGSVGEDGVLGTIWNEWETNWSGTESRRELDSTSRTVNQNNATPGIVSGGSGWIRTETTTNWETTRTGTLSRTGLETYITPRENRENLGPLTVSTEIIPFIRPRTVFFETSKMQPNTKLYSFFDGQNVSEFVKSATKVDITNVSSATSNWLQAKEAGVRRKVKIPKDFAGKVFLRGGNSGHSAKIYKIERVSTFNFILYCHPEAESGFETVENLFLIWPGDSSEEQSKAMGTMTSTTFTASSDTIKTDSAGKAFGLFDIPNSDNIKFKTGERIFRLTDQPNDSSDNQTESQTTYTASGIIENQSDQILLTRVPEFNTRSRTQDEPLTDISINTEVTAGGWYDPLAQTIMIKEQGGCFISAAEIFFSTKDAAKPVTLQLRETVNGYPGPKILGESVLEPDDVLVSDNGILPSEFVFPSPIYVRDGTEYCIVLLADTEGYRAHVARLGEESLDGSGVISKQPYAGVFFKSQNASTWTADQMEDLKFRISRAVFETSGKHEVYVENTEYDDNGNDLWSQSFNKNSMKVFDGLTKVTFFVSDSSGMIPTRHWRSNGYNYVILDNFHGTYSVFPHGSFNGAHLVTDTTINSFSIDLRNPFYPTTNGILSKEPQVAYSGTSLPSTDDMFTPKSRTDIPPVYKSNFKYDTIKPIIGKIELPETTIQTSLRGLSGTSQDSLVAPGITDAVYGSFIPNTNIILGSPKMIATKFNEDEFNTSSSALGKKSLVFKIEMSSTKDNLSPVIDTQRMSSILVSNKTNSPSGVALGNMGHVDTGFVEETESEGGSVATKYMTREVTIDQPATSIRVLATVNRQDGCEVDFYYRIKTSEDQKFSKLPYTLIPRTPIHDIASAGPDDFKEFDFDVRDLPEFTSLSIKIAMKTTNSSIVPKIRDLRIIALAS